MLSLMQSSPEFPLKPYWMAAITAEGAPAFWDRKGVDVTGRVAEKVGGWRGRGRDKPRVGPCHGGAGPTLLV